MQEARILYEAFGERVEGDLIRWGDRLEQEKQELEDYERTLKMIKGEPMRKLQVDLGSGFMLQAKPVNHPPKLLLKIPPDIFLQVTYPQAQKLIPSLISLSQDKVQRSQSEVSKILASRQELTLTLQKYSTIL